MKPHKSPENEDADDYRKTIMDCVLNECVLKKTTSASQINICPFYEVQLEQEENDIAHSLGTR